VRECTSALEGCFDAWRDAPVAAGTRPRFLVDQARQPEGLLDLRVTPAMRNLELRHRQREVERRRERFVELLRGVACVELEMAPAPFCRGVHDPRVR
jgi:hypothetical protein